MESFSELPGHASPNKEACIELISRYGFHQLGTDEGCRCSNFCVCGFEISVSCHKSEHCVRVYSHHLCRQAEDEVEIAALIIRQLGDSGSRYRIRYCDYTHDHVGRHWEKEKWVESYSCCYCSKPRADKEAYLCFACLGNKDAVSHYPFGIESLSRKCQKCGTPRIQRDFFGLSEMQREPLVSAGTEVGFSISGAFSDQKGESIFRCLGCGHHWREKD